MPIPPAIVGAGITAGAGLINNLFGNKAAHEANRLNFQSQQNLLNWQKEAQQTTWNREDSATQRKVADLKAAGISPHMAAGGGASSSGPVSGMKAPQRDPNVSLRGMEGMQKVVESFANIAQTLAQTQVLNAEGSIRKTSSQIASATKTDQIAGIRHDTEKKGLDVARTGLEIEHAKALHPEALRKMRLENEMLGLDKMHKAKAYVLDLKQKAKQLEISTTEAKHLAAYLKARIDGQKASTALSQAQKTKLTTLLPSDLTAAVRKNMMALLYYDDYKKMPPRVRNTVNMVLTGLRTFF